MSTLPLSSPTYRRELGDGLVLRWSTADDVERIGQLYSYVFRNKSEDPANTFIVAWTEDMMSGRHPLITAGDFALVEDTRQGEIVASTCLLGQTWEYAGVPFPIGRPEIVASLPDYRNRGLVRAVFELIHARSDGRGDMAQGITGIPYYYRQFGYEYALDLGGDRRVPYRAIPKLKDGEPEPYRLRDAVEDDLPLINRLYDRERTRRHENLPLLVSTPVSLDYWRHVLTGQRLEAGEGFRIMLIADTSGRDVGYLLLRRIRWDDVVWVAGLMVDQGVSLVAVMPSVLRGIRAMAGELGKRRDDIAEPDSIGFGLGRAHPVYDALGESLTPYRGTPYAWYVRVPDLPGFIRHVAPVLERRLADSILAGHTGELRLTFYRGGLRLAFEDGRLAAVEPWRESHTWGPRSQAGFPPLVFLQLLLGHRSLDELRHALPDVWAEDEAKRLLDALFPKTLSWALNLE